MGNGDISDLHQRGVPLDDIVRAAELDDPVLPKNTAAMAERGVELVASLRDAVQKAQSSSDAVVAITGLMADEVAMQVVGAAYHHKTGQVQAVLTEMRNVRGTSRALAELEKEAKRQAKLMATVKIERETQYRAVVLDKLVADLGVHGLVAPPGWRVDDDDGVVSPENEIVCPRPMVILGSSRDVDTGSVRLHLAWKTPGGWFNKHVQRTTALNHRKIVDLLDDEAPVPSTTSSLAVRYLAAFEKENAFVAKRSVSHMGWVDDRTFLHGRKAIGDDIFMAADDSVRRLVDACSEEGDFQVWKEAVERDVVRRPSVMLGIYASCASALLHVLNLNGFIFEWSGLSSRGKTTALTVAASCWGKPSVSGIIGKWNAPGVSGFLAQAWLFQSMPLLLDETKEGRVDVIQQLMYTHTSGLDRTRATRDGGLRHTNTWRSVLLSTGEAPITSFSKDQGARARCICLNGAPMGGDTEENREASMRLVEAMLENYGHIGPRFASYLIARRSEWVRLRSKFKSMAAEHASKGSTAMSRRLLESVAVLHMTANILHRDLGLPGDSAAAIELLTQTVVSTETTSDMPQLAADDLYSWAANNEDKFWQRTPKVREPNGGWFGRWEDNIDWTKIGFDPKIVEARLKEWGYDVGAILTAWSNLGWREFDRQGYNPNYGKSKARLLVMKRVAFPSSV